MRDREIKVNIFDMAGHPFFYEVSTCCFLKKVLKYISMVPLTCSCQYQNVTEWSVVQLLLP